MTQRTARWCLAIVCLVLLAIGSTHAGDAPQPENSGRADSGSASSGFSAHADTFRVDGALANGRLTFRVTRTRDASPVGDAHVTVESGPLVHRARAEAGNAYSIPADDFFRGGRFPLTFVIDTGGQLERARTEINIAASVASEEAKAQHIDAVRDYLEGTMLITLALVAALAGYLLVSRARARRATGAHGGREP